MTKREALGTGKKHYLCPVKKVLVVLLCSMVLAVSGCAMLDRWVGIDPASGDRVAAPGESGAEKVSEAAGDVWAPAGLLVSLFAGAYSHVRGRRYKKAALSTMAGVKDLKAAYQADKPVTYADLMVILKNAQDKLGARPVVEELLKKLP